MRIENFLPNLKLNLSKKNCVGIHGIGAVTALEVLSIFPETPEKDGETTRIVSILSSLRKFRDWWQNKSVNQKTNTLRNKLKNITITEDFPNIRVSKPTAKNVIHCSFVDFYFFNFSLIRLWKHIYIQPLMRIVKSLVGADPKSKVYVNMRKKHLAGQTSERMKLYYR